MAKGDQFVLNTGGIANGSFLDVEPSAGVEWKLHNVITENGGAIEIHFAQTGDTNTTKSGDAETTGVLNNLSYGCTHDEYIRIKNVSGGAMRIRADGMQTK